MSAGWPILSLGDLTVNHDAKRRPVKESERKAGPYPYYGASGIVDHVDGYLFDGSYLLIGEDGENMRTRQTPIAFMAHGKFWVNNHAHIVTGNHLADTRFLMYSVSNTDIHSYLTGAVMPKLTQGNLNKILLACPPIDVQSEIVGVLGALDDRITLLRETNATLEAIAQALFKSWFVDFDPVRAKMQGRAPEGMDEATAALFPDSLEESELGLVPRGWRVEPLTEVFDFKEGPGLRNWQYTNSDQGTKFINIRCIQDGDLSLATANRITDEEANGKYAHFHLKAWDVVVSTSGTLGRSAIVRQEHLPLMLNTSVIRFRPIRPKMDFGYCYQYLNSAEFLYKLESMASGSVQKNFGPIHIKQISLVCPSADLIARYESLSQPLIEKLIANRAQIATLATLRDTLLPRLISGALRLDTVA
jgi:type I restriction enzyme, S subunit